VARQKFQAEILEGGTAALENVSSKCKNGVLKCQAGKKKEAVQTRITTSPIVIRTARQFPWFKKNSKWRAKSVIFPLLVN
jgi:hypothetical protein